MHKILIIGGNGFIGTYVANYLSSLGYRIFIYDYKKEIKKNQNISYIYGNLLKSKLLEAVIKKVNYIFNFAALADIDKAKNMPEETAGINILGTIKILKLAKKYRISRFFQASSIYAYSDAGSFYAISKRSSEEYIEEFSKVFKLNYTILRFGTIYGEGADDNNGLKKLINSAKKKKIIYNGSKYATRRFIYVKDVAKLCKEVLKKKYINKCVVLTGKKNIKIRNIVNFLAKKFKIKKNFIIYKNIKNSVHYVTNPKVKKFKKGLNLYLKKEENFKNKLLELINKKIK